MKIFFSILTLFVFLWDASSAFASAGKAVRYKVNGETYEGYYLSPSPDAPLILLIHDWDGLTDYERKRAAMLTDLGYAVFDADLYGKGIKPEKLEEKRRLTGALYKDRKKMRALLYGALEAAKGEGGEIDRAVAIGYCFGGTAVLELARSGAGLKGFVTFHGGLETPEGQDYSGTKGELLIFHGSADRSVTMEQFASLAKELEEKGVKHEMITYSGAPHAFTIFGSDRYREDADRKSWERFTRFLSEVLK